MLPNRKIKENKLQRPNKKMFMQYGGAATDATASATSEEEEVPVAEAVAEAVAVPVAVATAVESADYKAPGILASLSKYSADILLQAIGIVQSAILNQLKIEPKEGQSSVELYGEVNKILEDPETRLAFLNFAKNVADKGLSFIQVARPVANKSIEAVIEIFDEIASKGGKSIVKIGKDVSAEIPILGSILGFIFLCDDIVKFFQSGIAAFFQTGTKANEVVVNTREKMKGASNLKNASPDIAAAAADVEKGLEQGKEGIISDLQKRITELEKEIGDGSSSSKRAEESISALGKTDEQLEEGAEKQEKLEKLEEGAENLEEEKLEEGAEKLVAVGGGKYKKSSKIFYKTMKRKRTKKHYKNFKKKINK